MFESKNAQKHQAYIYDGMPKVYGLMVFTKNVLGKAIEPVPYKVACKGHDKVLVSFETTPANAEKHAFVGFIASITAFVFWALVTGVFIWCAVYTLKTRTQIIPTPGDEQMTPSRGMHAPRQGGYVPPSVLG